MNRSERNRSQANAVYNCLMDATPSLLPKILFDAIRVEFRRRVPTYDPEAIKPETLATYRAIEKFVCPIRLLVIDCGQPIQFWGGDCSKVSYVHFDFEEFGREGYEFIGEIQPSDVPNRRPMVEEFFGGPLDDEHLESIASLRTISMSGGDKWMVRAVPHDIRVKMDVAAGLLFDDVISEAAASLSPRFDPRLDFTSIYKLEPSIEREVSTLLKDRPFFSIVSNPTTPGDYRHLRDRERRVAAIRLIPPVPESVRTTFEIAKNLFVYASFYHYFETAGKHYAFLAVEAGLKSRWCQSIQWPATVTSKGGDSTVVDYPSYDNLIRRVVRTFKSRKGLTVNSETLPRTSPALVDALLSKGMLTKWYAGRIKSALTLRNIYSHREFGTIDMMGVDDLQRIAEILNTLFHTPGHAALPTVP